MNQVSLAYAEFLAPHPWQLFLTLTFDRKHTASGHEIPAEHADKGFRRLVQFINERMFGKRWLRMTKHKGVIWARVDEAHQDGALHFHAVMYAPSSSLPKDLIRAIRDWWGRRFGMARAEVPRSRDDVLRYLTKHLTFPHLAEIQISQNFQKLE